jgi:hypothetical protein
MLHLPSPCSCLMVISSLFLLAPANSIAQEFHQPTVKKYEVRATFVGNDQKSYPLGLGSGLALGGVEENGAIELLMVTDRGPNADAPRVRIDDSTVVEGKFFPAPEYIPQIERLKFNGQGELLSQELVSLRSESGQVSGLIPPLSNSVMPEEALSLTMQRLERTHLGFDPEGITGPENGIIWLGEEYRPGLVEVELATGTIKRVLSPGDGLPKILASRQPNRGFEGVTRTPSGKIVAVIQSTLDINSETKNSSLFTRIVVFDVTSRNVTMYAYPHEAHHKIDDVKIGDITAISDTEFILIQAEKNKHGDSRAFLVAVSLQGATPIREDLPITEQPEFFQDRNQNGFVPVKRKVITNLNKLGWHFSKTEGVTFLPDGHTLVISNDNDFGTDVKVKLKGKDLILTENGTFEVAENKGSSFVDIDIDQVSTSLWFLHYEEDLYKIFH